MDSLIKKCQRFIKNNIRSNVKTLLCLILLTFKCLRRSHLRCRGGCRCGLTGTGCYHSEFDSAERARICWISARFFYERFFYFV